MAKRTRTKVIAAVSDTHSGSTVALCPPEIELDDGGSYKASKFQLWMWERWGWFWNRANALRDEHDAEFYQGFIGDLVDGNHHGTTQILSGNPNAQAAVVNQCLSVPLALKPDRLFFIRGTDVHVGQSACSEERIADGLRRDKRPVIVNEETGTASHWHFRPHIDGIRLDFAHHGRVGTRPWTKPNVVANLAAEIFYTHAANGIPHPHLAVRAHMHQLVDTHDQHPTRVIQLPAWQAATSFIHRIAPGAVASIGGIVIVIRNGEMHVEKIEYKPDPPRAWVAP
jgi:hypothetical protein